jgi:hypothetical protein
VRCLALLIVLAGCDDLTGGCSQPPDSERSNSASPSLRMLQYTPNAGFVNETNKITATAIYSDPNKDTSQGVIEFSDPHKQLVFKTAPLPVMGVGGLQGTATYDIEIAPNEVPITGIYHFCLWVVDLTALESNHLGGDIRIATRANYDNMTNP